MIFIENVFQQTPTYWPKGIENFVNDVQDDPSLGTHQDKVDEIWKGLETIQTL